MCKTININNVNNINNANNKIIHSIINKLKYNEDNPKLKIENIQYNNKTIHVIQDGYLIAGTKQRVATLFVKKMLKTNNKIDTLLYAGASNGFGAVATAYASYKLNLKSHVFLTGNLEYTRQINTLLALNANITICDTYRKARNMEYKLSNNPNKKWTTLPNYYIVPMGLNDENGLMVNLLSKQMRKALKDTILNNYNKEYRIWCVAGTGGIAESIQKTFPNSTIYIYLVYDKHGRYTKKVIEWAKKQNNIIILNDNKNYIVGNYNINNRKKYYSSIHNYDDLIWRYVKKYGQTDDIMWNVSSDDYLFLDE